mmetsp:Transcript_58758/g.108439  ORF Transcript_58758/g.108439 Transcript_58758/m.108439 type:complete len:203 (+) Transcript_58758:200-808(+)
MERHAVSVPTLEKPSVTSTIAASSVSDSASSGNCPKLPAACIWVPLPVWGVGSPNAWLKRACRVSSVRFSYSSQSAQPCSGASAVIGRESASCDAGLISPLLEVRSCGMTSGASAGFNDLLFWSASKAASFGKPLWGAAAVSTLPSMLRLENGTCVRIVPVRGAFGCLLSSRGRSLTGLFAARRNPRRASIWYSLLCGLCSR